MKQLNYQTGKTGESLALSYLSKNGYRLIEQNWRHHRGEIDLIVSKNRRLIFVEVKLKIGDQFGSPEEMINYHKLKQIREAAILFLQQNPQYRHIFPQYQIDAVCLVVDPDFNVKRLNHWENVADSIN
ncbi:MAG: YraN family protein [Candidatus Shapirobacteria bacterium]